MYMYEVLCYLHFTTTCYYVKKKPKLVNKQKHHQPITQQIK